MIQSRSRRETECEQHVELHVIAPPGVLFTFPSQYCSTIGHQVVFRLRGWSPHVLTGFLVSADTLDTVHSLPFSPTRLSLPLAGLPMPFD